MSALQREQEELAARQEADALGVDYTDTRLVNNLSSVSGLLTVDEMKSFGVVPLSRKGLTVELGYTESTDQSRFLALHEKLAQLDLRFHLISPSGFDQVIAGLDTATPAAPLTNSTLEHFTSTISAANQKDLFVLIMQQAYLLGASDVHIEPEQEQARIRFRIDGVLHPITSLPLERYQNLLADIQIRAKIKWNVDFPQAGRLEAQLQNAEGKAAPVSMRLETIPALHGQDIVIRIFNLEAQYLDLNNLGLSEAHRKFIDQIIAHPHGMVLAVGPTGSGKTSTLYAILSRLNHPEVKIVTLEDPVEYELPGISQIPVHSEDEDSFAEKLRAVLREDPDIVMIGEIRDADTAKTALQASLTGHLVLSTFHAASSAAAVSRLMDMIGQNPLLASAIRLIMAQRLIRRVCPDCRKAYEAPKEVAEEIRAELSKLPAKMRPNLDKITLYRGEGCAQCNHFGYRGRIGLIEQMPITPAMEKLISDSTAATTTQKIEELAITEGMITLLQDGMLKALSGATSIEEVYRVIDE
jgi:type II secretory ATPase GspE/PulE/Tfp pilus assembly ATPase PilB-like protein